MKEKFLRALLNVLAVVIIIVLAVAATVLINPVVGGLALIFGAILLGPIVDHVLWRFYE